MPNVVPFGDRILVKRKTIGEKAGSIYLPDEVKERATDLAEVVYIPEMSFADSAILQNAETIVAQLSKKASDGDSEALVTLLRLNEFCRWKSIQPGDKVMISKYVGIDFNETGSKETLTLVLLSDIIGLVAEGGSNG